MALHQNDVAEGRTPVAVAYTAGVETVNIYKHTFKSAFTAAADVLEIGMMPAGVRPTEITLIGAGITATQQADVGILDGDFGAADDARDFDGSAIATGLAVQDATISVDVADVIEVEAPRQNKGLGIKLSQDVTAGSGTLTIIMKHIATPK